MVRMFALAGLSAAAVAAGAALAADQSAGRAAAENPPETASEIDNTNRSEEAITHMGGTMGARGDATFALPATELIGSDLWYGRDKPIGTITELHVGGTGEAQVAVDREAGGPVLLPVSALEVQTGRDDDDWLLVTPLTAGEISALPPFDAQAQEAGVAVSDDLIGAPVAVGDEEIGTVEDVMVEGKRGATGVVVEREARSVLVPLDQVRIVRRDGTLSVESRMDMEALARLPDYTWDNLAEEVTAPGSPAADMARQRKNAD